VQLRLFTFKKIIYLTLLSVFIASCNSNLDNNKVENFVVEHFKNQTIEAEAINYTTYYQIQ